MARNVWRKSSRSGSTGNCVETKASGGAFCVRDSKLGDNSPVFGMTREDFSGFLRSTK
ncbi:DUF397 domain-containing protein [Natronoglycomyces albus]|uniref:DUF397 domain-containing protein n=1 Tax=Natronoglycomyces albus TaxID=2811108 RepID=A0A895XDS4_9ACTN|nr:DUF397 domain-containing protein [Natronoglycomyces albus]QSB03951.1 DUF397 domain-containing protein [Natronoglycomyces albus]